MPIRLTNSVLSIAVLAGIGSQHIYDALFFVDFVKETITADPVPPGLRLVILQFFNVFSKIGVVPELRIDIF